MKKKIVLADDHQLFLDGIKSLLERDGLYDVVGLASNGRELVDLVLNKKPDLIISDISMPHFTGLEAVHYIKNLGITTPWILLTMHNSPSLKKESQLLGIASFILKNTSGKKLLDAVSEVVNSRSRIFSLPPVNPKKQLTTLTKREKEIVQLVLAGKTSASIAEALELSIKTVETHRKNIYQKLDIHSIPELLTYARGIGMM